MQYRVVSGDSHMDMSWLPGDMFIEGAPSNLRDLMPHVEDAPTKETKYGVYSKIWVCEGKELGVFGSMGMGFSPPQAGMSFRNDRMQEAGYYEGDPHPSNPFLRIKDQDMDGIQAEVLYGLTRSGLTIQNLDVQIATFRIYNQWVADFCNTYPGRFYALACIPLHDPVIAAKELREAAGIGPLRGCELIVEGNTHPIYSRDGYWDPLWEAVADTQMPVSFHLGSGRIPVVAPPEGSFSSLPYGQDLSQNQLAQQGTTFSIGMIGGAQWLASIIFGGACERFPNFRFVLGEFGGAWVPFILGRMDHIFTERLLNKKLDPPLKLKPSEYWFLNGATTFQEEPVIAKMTHLIGENNLIWGSDYPHPDGVWPDSQEVIQNTLGELEPRILKKLICDNAVALYRMGD
ncbi:MAG: amidohydrolase [SAR202 cluster bacterium]|nr:amidohydrolase [SAR202 cluster bacterium]